MARKGKTRTKYDSDKPCANCGSTAEINALHHLNSQGSGSQDVDWNLCPLCVFCHNAIHLTGRQTFINLNVGIQAWVRRNGWYICPSSSKWRHDI